MIWINVCICGEVKPENTFSVTTLTQRKFFTAQPATAQDEESNVNSHSGGHDIGRTNHDAQSFSSTLTILLRSVPSFFSRHS